MLSFKVVVDQILVELALEFSQGVKEFLSKDRLVELLEYCSLKTFTGAIEHGFAGRDPQMLDIVCFEHLLETMADKL